MLRKPVRNAIIINLDYAMSLLHTNEMSSTALIATSGGSRIVWLGGASSGLSAQTTPLSLTHAMKLCGEQLISFN